MLKIEAKSFKDARQDIVSIQKVIWDHLPAFQGEIIQKQAFFSLPFRTPNNSRVVFNWVSVKCGPDGGGWRMADRQNADGG